MNKKRNRNIKLIIEFKKKNNNIVFKKIFIFLKYNFYNYREIMEFIF